MEERERLENALYQIDMKLDRLNGNSDEGNQDPEEQKYQKGKYDGLKEAREIVKKWKNKEVD